MNENKKIDVVFLSAGKGCRVNLGYPKQYQMLEGKPLFMHSLEIIKSIPEVNNIIICCDNIDKMFYFVDKYKIDCKLIKGGQTRQESVFEGLKYVNTKEILICEAARPFITSDFIKKILSVYGNVIPYTKLDSTPFNKFSGNVYNRNDVVCVQTPQKYILEDIKESYQLAKKLNIANCTDDLDLMKKVGIVWEYKFIEGLQTNIKITYKHDLYVASSIKKFSNGGWE